MRGAARYVLDAGALIAIETSPRGDLARRVQAENTARRAPLLPAVVWAQVWRGSTRQHGLARLRRACVPVAFDDDVADRVGILLAHSRTSDVVDAAVVLAAMEHDAAVVTADPGDLARLADSVGYALSVVPV